MVKIKWGIQPGGFSLKEFRWRLIFFVVIVLLPLHILAIFNIYNGYRQEVDQMTTNGLGLVRTVVSERQKTIVTTEPFLAVLSRLSEVRAMDAGTCTWKARMILGCRTRKTLDIRNG